MADRWILIRTWLWRVAKLTLAVGVVGALVYWLRWSPMPVVEHRVERGVVVAEVMGTGTLEARVKTVISPKISGRIREIHVDQGDRVTAGQLLVRLDELPDFPNCTTTAVLRRLPEVRGDDENERTNPD
ncbi:MAG: biotin/lipoyl-binding protein, partial [Planctomycetia bacterium]|nr:biotin/lipoyl-binding protein [Planctomycetia bacterium]